MEERWKTGVKITVRRLLPMTPADKVIAAFSTLVPNKGPREVGIAITARYVGRSTASVCRWRTPIEAGGTGGRVPPKSHAKILAIAKEKGLNITAEDLIV
jgi:hypothetical protein